MKLRALFAAALIGGGLLSLPTTAAHAGTNRRREPGDRGAVRQCRLRAGDGAGERSRGNPFGDGLRQSRIGVAGDQFDRAVLGGHRRFSPRLAGYDVQHLGYL